MRLIYIQLQYIRLIAFYPLWSHNGCLKNGLVLVPLYVDTQMTFVNINCVSFGAVSSPWFPVALIFMREYLLSKSIELISSHAKHTV